jgi:serine/threonine protein kinase
MAPVKDTNRQAIIFPEGKESSKGYVLCETVIEQGTHGWVFAVRSLSTGMSYIRKRFKPNSRTTSELEIYPRHSSHVAPALIQRTEYKGEGDALIYDLCNGGDLTSFLIKTSGMGPISEVFVWHLAKQLIEILAYIQYYTPWMERRSSLG